MSSKQQQLKETGENISLIEIGEMLKQWKAEEVLSKGQQKMTGYNIFDEDRERREKTFFIEIGKTLKQWKVKEVLPKGSERITGYNLFRKAECEKAIEKGEKISLFSMGQMWKQLKETGGQDEWNKKAKKANEDIKFQMEQEGLLVPSGSR
jgi:hypothetical protein